MESWDKVKAVDSMQRYIEEHIGDRSLCLGEIAAAVGYSTRHAARIFKELTGFSPEEYIRAIRLTQSAKRLTRDRDKNILDAALDSGFASHEGYTRAFSSHFGVTPHRYRNVQPPIPLFTVYPVRHYQTYLKQKERDAMQPISSPGSIVTVTPFHRPRRRAAILFGKSATDYFSFCEEMGCDWEGLLNSIPVKMDTAALLTLPANMARGGCDCAAGVEVPEDYNAPLPDGYEYISLPPCDMLCFQSAPFENEDDFGIAIGNVIEAIAHYDPTPLGYAFDAEAGPRFNFGATAITGAKLAVPVRKL